MTVTISKEEITEDEMAAISGFLARVKGGEIPNIEALDGFLTALVISPDLVKPSEFTPVIIRGATEDACRGDRGRGDHPDSGHVEGT